MKRITLPVVLNVQGPILTRSSSIGAMGVDAPMAFGTFQDAAGAVEKRFYLPGRLVKGLLREAWQELGYHDLIQTWLGDASAPGSDDEPLRGRLVFRDFVDFTRLTDAHLLRYRIAIDELRGAADTGMMQVIDSPYAPGEPVTFEGSVRCLVATGENVSPVIDALERGLHWIRAVGGTRTAGFGEVLSMQAGPARSQSPGPGTPLTGSRWEVRIRFDEHMILAKRLIARNLFESSDVVAGGALKGALADMIGREKNSYQELMEELHLVRFTHAVPALPGAPRPAHWPLSLVCFGKDSVEDVIRTHGPILRDHEAGAFDIDWKEPAWDCVRRQYDHPPISRELRVRTAIDSLVGKARDQALFAWQMVVPFGLEWAGMVDAGRLTPAARQQLEAVLRFGLEPVGKTKAIANTTVSAAPSATVASAPDYVVTLQTPALLIHPVRRLAPDQDEAAMFAELSLTWGELSHRSLELVRYFHRNTLAGGDYFRTRFGRGKDIYKPYLLSDAGSTFLLRPVPGKEAEALAYLDRWAANGLPLTDSVRDFYSIPADLKIMWQHCPYLPENGYGEIAVNQKSPFPEA